jgi:hypothetical protein
MFSAILLHWHSDVKARTNLIKMGSHEKQQQHAEGDKNGGGEG